MQRKISLTPVYGDPTKVAHNVEIKASCLHYDLSNNMNTWNSGLVMESWCVAPVLLEADKGERVHQIPSKGERGGGRYLPFHDGKLLKVI